MIESPATMQHAIRSLALILACASTAAAGDLTVYHIGNSLTRNIPLDRLKALFADAGTTYRYGQQLGPGFRLEMHLVNAEPGTPIANIRRYNLVEPYGQYSDAFKKFTFDAVVLQPFQMPLDLEEKIDKPPFFTVGDLQAASGFIDYARGRTQAGVGRWDLEHPNTDHVACERFFIYATWPPAQEILAHDPPTFAAYYAQPYTGGKVSCADFYGQLVDRLNERHSDLPTPVRMIPAGGVLATLDERIRAGTLPGIEAFYARNQAYFVRARRNDRKPSPFDPDAFDPQAGVLNVYADGIHLNDQPHNGDDSGTIGSYVAALTTYATLTGKSPVGLTAEPYEQFDPQADAALVRALQETVWQVVSTHRHSGVAAGDERPPRPANRPQELTPAPLPAAAPPRADDDGLAFFETHVRPLLAAHCYECHAAVDGNTSGDLALDTRAGWQRGGQSGPAIVPGDPDASLLMKVVRRDDPDWAMPPDSPLPAEAVKTLERWIRMGAPDPRDGEPRSRTAAQAALWSLQPVRDPPVPTPDRADWIRGPVDAFLLAAMRTEGLEPAEDADVDALARRLWFTLVGLPPTPEEHRAFRDDMAAGGDVEATLAGWVDRLLASPQFGEKWARHWLDVARYAESNGKALNNGLPHAWRYRDWVIAALNADTPYDRFLTEQLAGDLLPAGSQADRDALHVATGFLAIGSKEQFGGCGSRSVAEVQPEWVDDQLNVLGRGILGINVACSRCHDHKFDPVPMRDYYALAGIFFSTEILSGRKGGAAAEFGQPRLYDPDAVLLGDPARAAGLRRLDAQAAAIRDRLNPVKKRLKTLSGDERAAAELEIAGLEAELDRLAREAATAEWAFGVRDAERIADTPLRRAGAWNKPGDVVPRGFLTAVHLDEAFTIPADASGRLQLARWLTHPSHPLTARVFVNRVWHHVFGRGLVPTTDNFGTNGEPPSHPDLLDHLAHRFVRKQGWSLKRLVRELVLSRAFRQSSTPRDTRGLSVDPDNRLLARAGVRRLDAEAIRDAVLATSGRLDLAPRRGTAPLLAEMSFKGLGQPVIDKLRKAEAGMLHRSVYLAVIRNDTLDDTQAAFDFPNNDEPATERAVASGPTQSLLLMNSPLVIETARYLAGDIAATIDDDGQRVAQAFIRILGRPPTTEEAAAATSLVGKSDDGLALLCQGLYQTAEFRILR